MFGRALDPDQGTPRAPRDGRHAGARRQLYPAHGNRQGQAGLVGQSGRNIHSIDFHAVTGPGGGAAVTQVAPGETRSFTFTALNPGLYVYHCATPMVAQHISNGMYGMILVEPAGGLPPVDREFYVMQGELYTAQKHGSRGLQDFSVDKLLDEKPEHLMFNGTMNALTETYRMEANVGETVRIYFGVGGPNLSSQRSLGDRRLEGFQR